MAERNDETYAQGADLDNAPAPTNDDSFEAANAIPVITDDDDDAQSGRTPIDLDAPIDLGQAVSDAGRASRAYAANQPSPSSVIDNDDLQFDAAPAAASSAELEALRTQAADANDKYLRTLAEFQNYRRRTDDSIKQRVQEGNEKLLKELLPVLDDFDLALQAARQSQSYEQLIGGVQAVQRKFSEAIMRQGVAPIETVGEPFDPDVHEAVMVDEGTDAPDETVTAELRKGYTFHGRVMRPALVKVAKSG